MTDERFNYYYRVEERLKFDLSYFNRITKSGPYLKHLTLSCRYWCCKSCLCVILFSSVISQGKNVLYITLEITEERIAERIDANLLDVTIDDLYEMSKRNIR
ncbi:MAG: hypothetical protein CM15mV18_0770 [uncultured marine virus]|nr:MAG: hypothetical protein CM15mV18_0770 [uncultured marine virus]